MQSKECQNRRHKFYLKLIDERDELDKFIFRLRGKHAYNMDAELKRLDDKILKIRKQIGWAAKNLQFLQEFSALGMVKENDDLWLETLKFSETPNIVKYQWPRIPVHLLEVLSPKEVAHIQFKIVCKDLFDKKVAELVELPGPPLYSQCASMPAKYAWLEKTISKAAARLTTEQVKSWATQGYLMWLSGQLKGGKGADKEGALAATKATEEHEGWLFSWYHDLSPLKALWNGEHSSLYLEDSL